MNNLSEFIEEHIDDFVCVKNNIYTLENKLTGQTIRISRNNKACVNGKWIACNVRDISAWYDNTNIDNAIDNKLNVIRVIKQEQKTTMATTLKNITSAKNQAQRRKHLSEFLQEHNVGDLCEKEAAEFARAYAAHYVPCEDDDRPRFTAEQILRVSVELHAQYASKCYFVYALDEDGDMEKYTASIKRFC